MSSVLVPMVKSLQKSQSAEADSASDDDSIGARSDKSGSLALDADVDVADTEDEVVDTEDKEALFVRKVEFYKEFDIRINSSSQLQKTSPILSDELFDEIFSFMQSIQDASDEDRIQLLRSIPNKLGYKWIKRYDITTVDTRHVLIFKQADGEALDTCCKVVKYSQIFDVVRKIHEVEAGNDHPKSKTLYKRVSSKYGKSIPRWVCEMFPNFCPVCIRSKPRKKAKAGHQPLLTRGMNVRAQIDLIDYQSMPDGPFNYVLDYQDHGIKFCQLRALTQRTHRAIALELIQIFCIFGPPSILQADNGREFSHGASKSRHMVLDEEVSTVFMSVINIHHSLSYFSYTIRYFH